MENIIKSNFTEMASVFNRFANDEKNIISISAAAIIMVEALNKGNKIIACGNGGSLCDASHFAEELLARFRRNRKALPALAINDPAYITCVGNDLGFNVIFSRFIEACGLEGDVLLGISTSGNSQDVILAAEAAKALGMKVVAMTGSNNTKLSNLCDVEISAPATEFSDRVQEIHIKVIHTLVQLIENAMGLER